MLDVPTIRAPIQHVIELFPAAPNRKNKQKTVHLYVDCLHMGDTVAVELKHMGASDMARAAARTAEEIEVIVDRFAEAVIYRETAQGIYAPGADREVAEARAAIVAAIKAGEAS